VAEYWNDRAWRWKAVAPPPDGMGFDAALGDGLRDAIRDAIAATTHGRDAHVPLAALAAWLHVPQGFPDASAIVQCIENHDLVYERDDPMEWRPRVARLGDPADPRSWHARSRARAATALLLTAPGIPMLFMGQEILEDRNWSDNPRHAPATLVRWGAPRRDRAMRDHLACTRDLVHLRRALAALRGDGVRVIACDEAARVLAFHRWAQDGGEDVVVVASLAESTSWSYAVGFPAGGAWREAFNSDVYEAFPNPEPHGNGGRVVVDGPPLHGLAQSARLVIPANGVLVLVRE
jgi:1,4-alpha-glucan branching enzyme